MNWNQPINHNLLRGGIDKHCRWLIEISQYAASVFARTQNLQDTWNSLKVELIKGQIVRDVGNKTVLSGTIFVSEYDPKNGRIKVAATTFAGAGSYLLTKEGAYVHGEDGYPAKSPRDVKKCQQIIAIVGRHDPILARQLAVLAT